MSIIKRNRELMRGFPTFFNDPFIRDFWNWGTENTSYTGTTVPAVNIKEDANNFMVEMAAPGMNKEDFKVELDGNILTITSEKEEEHEEREGDRYSRKEFSYQAFTRTFNLPKDVVDADNIEARYDQGVLYLVIPKKEEAKQKPPRMINIA